MTDTPKWYLAEPFMLGADMPDGWEGRRQPNLGWRTAADCRSDWPNTIHETRPVPERMVTLPPLPESVVRKAAEWTPALHGAITVRDACREAVEKLDGKS